MPRPWAEAPKLLVAKLGQDGHDRGAKIIASAFADIGFEMVVRPLFQTPAEAADLAVASKVHVVACPLAAGHRALAPQLVGALKARGAGEIMVAVGGVVPRQDYQFPLDQGVSAVFGPGTNVLDAARGPRLEAGHAKQPLATALFGHMHGSLAFVSRAHAKAAWWLNSYLGAQSAKRPITDVRANFTSAQKRPLPATADR